MGLFCLLVFLGGGLCFAVVAFGKSISSGGHGTSKGFSCKNTIRVFFASDTWTTQIGGIDTPRYINQDQFFVANMGQIVTTADGKGISCTFDELSYVLACCGEENLFMLYSVDKRKLTADSKLWSSGIFRVNVVFLFVNLFFFMLLLGWGIHKLANNAISWSE